MEYSGVTKVLGGQKILRKQIKNRFDLIELSKAGLSKNALLKLAKYLGLSISEVAQLLPVTLRTLQRYSLNEHFNKVVSEHILQIAEVAANGEKVFGSKEKFLLWMNHPHSVFKGSIPMSLLNSKFGIEMVADELGRIEYGVYS